MSDFTIVGEEKTKALAAKNPSLKALGDAINSEPSEVKPGFDMGKALQYMEDNPLKDKALPPGVPSEAQMPREITQALMDSGQDPNQFLENHNNIIDAIDEKNRKGEKAEKPSDKQIANNFLEAEKALDEQRALALKNRERDHVEIPITDEDEERFFECSLVGEDYTEVIKAGKMNITFRSRLEIEQEEIYSVHLPKEDPKNDMHIEYLISRYMLAASLVKVERGKTVKDLTGKSLAEKAEYLSKINVGLYDMLNTLSYAFDQKVIRLTGRIIEENFINPVDDI